MAGGIAELEFPVIAISRVGWWKEASEPMELSDASPDDDLSEWQGMEIYDSARRHFIAARVYQVWPRSRSGGWLCKLFGNVVHIDFEPGAVRRAGLVELRQLLENLGAARGVDLRGLTHREVLERIV